ncbi:titin homolog isoform X4 [Lytechinus variegatus]|uniref:titin homolog isoform X4 n=1 Tax=Lytechinus variegatus TaxID=7654 RepID=UPI001BB11725|nr:titin homolog isoform X4 [Lytechinus variegatus]
MLSDLCRGTGVVRHGKIEVIPDGRSEGNTPTCKKTTGPARAWPQRNRPKKAQPKTGNGVFTFKQRWNLAYAGNCETAQIRPLGIPRVTSATVSVKKSKAVNDAKFSAMWSHYMSTSSESSSTPTSGESQLSSSSSVSLDDVEPWEDENEEWDYHNIQGRRFYLPPLQQHAWAKEEQVSPREVRVHKTYTTRKGALLLYAEDLALTSEEGANVKKRSMEAEDTSYFNSISDLRNAVLSYGSSMKQQSFQPAASQVNPSQEPFLGFVHNKRSHGPYKTVRPGFSAKRYLANWSRSWDDSILNYLRSEGHIWDKNLFQQNVLAPNLYRRINDDLSHVPLPYRVTRNMLMSPGEFESLEFYRIRPDSTDADGHALTLDEIYDRLWGYDDDDGYDADIDVTENGSKAKKKKPFNLPGSIAMIVRDMQQKPHAVQYEQLDEGQQRQVLQRLLLQSALHQQQHLRMIREENEKKKTETEDGEKDSADSSGKRPMPLLSGQPKQRRTDTDMTLYGSPSFQVPDAQDVDMEQAIANLITSNSTNIIGGATAFTDQTILDMYRSMRSKTMKPPAPPPSTSPSQWPHGSKRRVKNSMYHTYPSNFAGIQPLPPIQNSFEGNAGAGGDFMRPVPPPKQGTGPPVITMEPPTPQHPKLSAKSKLSVGWSSHSKTRSKSSTHSSSETNIWKADINENDLLQEAEREEIENDRASSDQELWTKSPRSSNQGSSKKASSKNSAVSKASKGSGESNVALSINSHLSHSMENLASPVEKALSFRAAGSVPTRLRESMRSYKGSGKSSHGSVLFGDSEGDLLITGSKQGSTYAPSVGSLADKAVASPVESTQEPPSIASVSIEPSESLEVPGEPTPVPQPDPEQTNETEINQETSDVGSTDNVAGSPDEDEAHSNITVPASLPSVSSSQDVVTNASFDSSDDESIFVRTIGAIAPTFSSLDQDVDQEHDYNIEVIAEEQDGNEGDGRGNSRVKKVSFGETKSKEFTRNQSSAGNLEEMDHDDKCNYHVFVSEEAVQVRETVKDVRENDNKGRQNDDMNIGSDMEGSVLGDAVIEDESDLDQQSNRVVSTDGDEDAPFAIDVEVTYIPASIENALDSVLGDVIESVFKDSLETIVIDFVIEGIIDIIIEDGIDHIIETDMGEDDDSKADLEDSANQLQSGLGLSMTVFSYKQPKPEDYLKKWKRKWKRSLKEKAGSLQATDPRRKNEFPSEADGDETKTVDRSVKLGQGVIDLPMSEPVESSRDKMSDTRRSVTYSKKSSSTQGSIKADSVHSGKGDLDVTQSFQNFSYTWKGKGSRRASKTSRDDDTIGELSDDEKEDNWPGQPDRSKPDSVKGEGDDQADISSKRGGSVAGSESEVEIEVDLVDDENKDNEGEAGEDGDIKSGSGMSSLLEAPVSVAGSVRSRPRTVEAQLEQLVEAASVVVDEIMQRPKSGRDLAEDAMMAAEIWSGKLGELFTEEDTYPERVRSAPYRRRRNSLDNESDTSSMLEEKVEPYERTTPMSSRRTRKIRRIHSAEAAVTLLRHLLKASDPDTLDTLSDADLESLISRVAEENINVKIGEEVSEMIENQDNLNHQDIVVVEDISERKIIIESIASTTDYGGDTEEDEEDEIKTVSEKEFTVRSRASVMEEEAAKETIDDGVKSALAVLTPKPPASAASKASSRVPSGAPSGTPSKVSSKAPSVVVDSPKGEVTEVKAVPPAPSSAPPKAPSPQPQPQVELSIGAEPVKVPVVKEKESKRRKSSKSADSKKGDATGDGAQENGPLGFGVTNLGVAEKKDTEKSTLVVRAPPEPEKPADDSDAKLNDELAKIVQETGLLDQSSSKSKKGSMSTKTSTKSNKSSKSSKSSKSKKSKDAEEDDKDAFIVGVPKESKTDILLYKPMTPEPPKEQPKPPPKEKKKIQKKTKKPAAKQEKPKKTKKPAKDETKSPNTDKIEDEEAKLKAEKEKQEEEERKKKEEEDKAAKEAAEKNEDEAEEEEEEDEGRASPESPEFIFVQDEFSDSEEEEKPVSLPPELPVDEIKLEPSVSAAPSEDYSEMTDFTEDSTSQGPNSISRSQAKAFKRAAEAEKRKAAVEKKRREREEAKKRAQDEAERAERIKLEYEEEKRRKEAEALERAAKAAEERERLARQEEERKRQAAIAAERERRQQAEYKRKMEEMARKKREEDMKRKAEEEQRRKEEEERKRIEAEMLAAMEEAERLEFEKRRKAEELEAARIAEEERIKREIEEKIAEEKARLLAIELAKRQKEVEARLAFNKELHSEANVFAHSQDMTRAFTWSYFELLEHLGIEIPDSLKEHYKEIAESKDDG